MISTSKGSFSPRTTVIVILLLTGPLSLDTASLIVRPLIDSPLMPIIKSPGCMPAFAAGVSSIGETTFTKPPSIVISIPNPPKVPFVFTCISLYDSGLKYEE